MEYIKWDDKLSVNIASIDIQHKKLIEVINDFYDGIGKKRNKEIINDLLYQLKRYSINHFQTEELLMKRYFYQGYKEHKEEHDEFALKIDELQKKVNEGKMVLSIELTSFLKDWITNHILITDKAYSAFLNGCGVK
jgi:hemerythrin